MAQGISMRCDRCKHWDFIGAESEQLPKGIRQCFRAHVLWDLSEWRDEGDDYIRVLKPEAAKDKMFVQDGSDYRATLLTKAEFFCAHFEPLSEDSHASTHQG